MAMTEANKAPLFFLLVICTALLLPASYQLQSSQAQTLLRIQKLLEFPEALKGLNTATDFCKLSPSASLTIVCHGNAITQLRIVGRKDDPSAKARGKNGTLSVSDQILSPGFSVDSLFITLTRLHSLRVVFLVSLGIWGSLPSKLHRLAPLEVLNISSNFFYGIIPQKISSMRNIRTLVLDNNMFNGSFPDWLSALPHLETLSMKNNALHGHLPSSLGSMQGLRALVLSGNKLSGNLPDLSTLNNLQVLDLARNNLGPQFPALGKCLTILLLGKNKFRDRVPLYLGSLTRLQSLDLSFNALYGLPPSSLFSLPSIQYLNLAGNLLRGDIPQNLSCSASLEFVDISSNFLTGELPPCLLSKSKNVHFKYAGNCLSTEELQRRHGYCGKAHTPKKASSRTHKTRIVVGIVAGILGLLPASALGFWLLRRTSKCRKATEEKRPRGTPVPQISSAGISSNVLTNARYMSQSMGLGAHGLRQYRAFTLEELEEATNKFDQSAFMGEGSHGKLYKGSLEDGTLVAIRCLKLEHIQTTQHLKLRLDLLSKFRHQYLVNLLGHCIDYEQDGSTVKRVFLIFEYLSNGTLQSHLFGSTIDEQLTWAQRLTIVIGVARAIHFLHTGVIPGIFDNDLKISNILLDQNGLAKVSDYGLLVLTKDMIEVEAMSEGHKILQFKSPLLRRKKVMDKDDIYNFGLILLEVIVGRLPSIRSREAYKVHETVNLVTDPGTRWKLVDPAIMTTCVDESLATVIGITGKCLSEESTCRPSMEDVLWNLQYAAQVQNTSASEFQGDADP